MTNASYRSVFAGVVAPLLVASFVALVPMSAQADGMDGGYTGFIDTAPSSGGYSGYIDSYPSSGGGYSGYIDSYPSSGGGYSGYIDNYPTSYGGGYSGYVDTYPSSQPSYVDTSPSWQPAYVDTSPSWTQPVYYSQPYNTYNNNYRTDFSYYPGTYYASTPYVGSSYDYSYDYVYDYYSEYTYDACSSIPGDQPSGYDCHQERDYCSNIPGNQPSGYDCNRDRNDNVSCDLSVSDSTVEDGDRVTLEWETDGNPSSATINQGIGRVDEDGGSERVRIDGDTTFRMTVRNSSGDEDTCSVTVRVDDNNNFSSVSFVGDPTNNPPVVYLSDIPYTGLEDISPALLSYWLMLIAAAAGGVWFLYTKGMIPTFAFASAEPVEEDMVGDIAEGSGHATPEVENFLAALANNDSDKALDYVREAAHNGTGVEEFLASAESVATDSELQARVSAALAESRNTGIRGVKAILA